MLATRSRNLRCCNASAAKTHHRLQHWSRLQRPVRSSQRACKLVSEMSLTVAESLTSRVRLSDGVMMPLFGLGMSRVDRPEEVVSFGIKHGYRLIDTAVRYGNEEAVGRAIKESGVEREDLFVVSKVWSQTHGYDNCIRSVKDSLARLGMEYIDLYLIHSPFGDRIVETYDALLEMKSQGLIRSVGVSNFDIKHLEGLKASGRPLPSVNQFELHPWYQRPEVIAWCRDHGVMVMGYSPLVKGEKLDDPKLLQLAEKYNKTPAQLLIRWSVQHGFITIPKSSRAHRVVENTQVFNWTLEDGDVKLMNSWNCRYVCAWDPSSAPWNG